MAHAPRQLISAGGQTRGISGCASWPACWVRSRCYCRSLVHPRASHDPRRRTGQPWANECSSTRHGHDKRLGLLPSEILQPAHPRPSSTYRPEGMGTPQRGQTGNLLPPWAMRARQGDMGGCFWQEGECLHYYGIHVYVHHTSLSGRRLEAGSMSECRWEVGEGVLVCPPLQRLVLLVRVASAPHRGVRLLAHTASSSRPPTPPTRWRLCGVELRGQRPTESEPGDRTPMSGPMSWQEGLARG